jgi:hypothetical protein
MAAVIFQHSIISILISSEGKNKKKIIKKLNEFRELFDQIQIQFCVDYSNKISIYSSSGFAYFCIFTGPS